MKKEELKNKVAEPSADYLTGGHYTYADYLTWQMEEMVELIKGKIFRQAAAPRVNHQRIARNLITAFSIFLKEKKCEAFIAPFDVRLPVKSKKNEDIDTVVQPDICIVYDPPDFDTGTPKIKNRTFLPVFADSRSKTGFSSAFSLLI